MTLKTLMSGALAAALVAGPMAAAAPAQPKEMFIPLLVYRTGPYAPSGIPIANGFVDYFTLLNERDGGTGSSSPGRSAKPSTRRTSASSATRS